MTRESLNITVSESLRKAQIRPRLDTLAEHTGLTATQIAGRALTLGLGLIESDLRLIFPGQAPTSAANPCPTPASPAQPSAEANHVAPPCAAMPSIEPQRTAASNMPPTEAAPSSDTSPRRVSTNEAARALGYRETSALLQHCKRHPELRRLSKKQGRCCLWDLEKLRAEYERHGWQPK